MIKLIVAFYVIATTSGLVFLKLGSTAGGAVVEIINNKLHFNYNPYSLLGIAFYGLSFILYTYLISKYDLGYIIPLTASFIYVLVFLASLLIFKEVFTTAKVLGIALILSGLFFLNNK